MYRASASSSHDWGSWVQGFRILGRELVGAPRLRANGSEIGTTSLGLRFLENQAPRSLRLKVRLHELGILGDRLPYGYPIIMYFYPEPCTILTNYQNLDTYILGTWRINHLSHHEDTTHPPTREYPDSGILPYNGSSYSNTRFPSNILILRAPSFRMFSFKKDTQNK